MEPADAYRRLAVDTGAAHAVVVTHAHYDHIGNADLFPRFAGRDQRRGDGLLDLTPWRAGR